MIHAEGKVRSYDPAGDTCSVELESFGVIDVWLDNLRIDASLNRAFLAHGAPVTLTAPDPYHLAEAIVVGVGAIVSAPQTLSGTTPQSVQTGRGLVATDGTGAGSAGVVYPAAYTAPPALAVLVDDGYPFTLGAIAAGSFSIAISGAPPNWYIGFSWQAQGH